MQPASFLTAAGYPDPDLSMYPATSLSTVFLATSGQTRASSLEEVLVVVIVVVVVGQGWGSSSCSSSLESRTRGLFLLEVGLEVEVEVEVC